MIALTLCVASVFPGALGVENTDGFDILRRLVTVDVSEYPLSRDEILKQRQDPWDVAAASAESWELGVAAFVLNARQQSPEAFARWDKLRPTVIRRNMTWYNLSRGGGTYTIADWIAFYLERICMPGDDKDRERCLNDLRLGLAGGPYASDHGKIPIWRPIWEDCPIELLRDAAVFFLASSGDPDDLDIVAEVLSRRDDAALLQTQHYCLSGLWNNDLPEAGELVLAEWQWLQEISSLDNNALGALAASPSPKAREAVYAYALDQKNANRMRQEAVIKCSLRRHPGDGAFVQKFLDEVESVELKRDVLMDLGQLPLPDIRPALLDVLRESSDSKIASAAALALTNGYIKAKNINQVEIAADIALLEEVAGRTSLDDTSSALIRIHTSAIKEQRDRKR